MGSEAETITRRGALTRRTATTLVVTLVAATLTAALGAKAVELGAATPATITVSPASVKLSSLGDTVRMTTAGRGQNGPVMSGMAVMWTGSDPAVATVDGVADR